MERVQVYLETSAEALAEGGYLAHVPGLIGCAARGKTKQEAIEKMRAAIVARLKGAEPPELDVIETEALTLPPDYVPLSDKELEALWERAAASRQALLDTLAAMSSSALTWRENRESWAIRNVLGHMAEADLWYASRLEEGGLRALVWQLSATRALLLRRLRDLPAAAHDQVTCHDGEEWTARKVARRMLEHEQEHLEQIRSLLNKFAEEADAK